MASQPERIASLETTASIAKWVLGVFIPLVIGWGAFITMNVIAMKQAMADGGNTKLVTELKVPKSPEQLRANLSTVIAQIETARVNDKKPDQKKIEALSGAVSEVVQKNPQLPEAWQAVATLASYRSADVLQISATLPGCDVSQKPHLILPSEVAELPFDAEKISGYIFRNCTLHLDHLPQGQITRGILNSQAGIHPPGTLVVQGEVAFVINSVIVLNDSGISETNIISFSAVNCRFDYQVQRVPSPETQKLLIASLGESVPGRFSVGL
jgi:hypothetical protein